MFTTADRDAVLDRAVQLLAEDHRIEAAVLTGSLGRGTGDRWSDIDLDAVITAGAERATVAAEWEELAYREWPVANHYATEFGATLVRGFLLRDALLLDMAFTPIEEFAAWAPVRVLFDRTGRTTATASSWKEWSPTPDARVEAGFAAHDVLHATVAANRRRRWQSLYYLQRIRNRTLSLASERHGWDSDDFTRVDDLPADEIGTLEDTLVATLDRDALLGAVDIAARAFLTELGRHDRALADRLSEPLLEIVTASRQVSN
jgi:predicted nucleotidyltransferase